MRGDADQQATMLTALTPNAKVSRPPDQEIFGWVKTVGGGRKLRYIGVRRATRYG